MGGSTSASIGRGLYWLLSAIAVVVLAYTLWFIFLSPEGEMKDRALVGVLYLFGAGISFAAANGFHAALAPE